MVMVSDRNIREWEAEEEDSDTVVESKVVPQDA